MSSGSDAAEPSAELLADRVQRGDSTDRSLLEGVVRDLQPLIAGAAPGVALLLTQASSTLTTLSRGAAADPEAAKAAAIRFLRAAQVSAPAKSNTAPPSPFAFEEADRELVLEFVQEASDYIGQAEAAMLVLEGNPLDSEAIDTVFRSFHTVKGVSAMLGLEPIASFAHKAESLLSRVRAKEISFSGRTANLSLAAVDALKVLLSVVQSSLSGEACLLPDLAELSQALVEATSGPIAGPVDTKDGRRPRRKQKAAAAGAEESPAPVAPVSPPEVRNVSPALPTAAAQAPPATAAPSTATTRTDADSSVRVRTERLDRLVDLVGELVIAQSMVRQDPTVVSGEHHDLSRKVAHAGKIVRELQDLAMSLRMVPLKPTFQKMARVVRDTAQKSGKEVELLLSGEDTEIDRNMVDVVADPLVHMLRNAVDHGIEAPGTREARGKRRCGTVRLSATHAGGNVVVELADDGAGLDRARIVKRAIERGLIESDAGMTDSDVFSLIFEPGFSTVDKVTDLSGRGVGMDVVRRNVQALNGRIEIASTLDQGTTFTLRLPLTLAVTDGMLVRVGGERYIVPIVNIRTSLRPSAEQLSTVSGRGEMLVIRGELIPMFRLSRLFGVPAATADATKGLAVIINGLDGQCAILVDELLGQQQVVAKSLGSAIGAVRGIAGGAILGDGKVGLILDTPEIIALAREDGDARPMDAFN